MTHPDVDCWSAKGAVGFKPMWKKPGRAARFAG
jgi:hypothetical protein